MTTVIWPHFTVRLPSWQAAKVAAGTHQVMGLVQRDQSASRAETVHILHVWHDQHLGLRLAGMQRVEVDSRVEGSNAYLS